VILGLLFRYLSYIYYPYVTSITQHFIIYSPYRNEIVKECIYLKHLNNNVSEINENCSLAIYDIIAIFPGWNYIYESNWILPVIGTLFQILTCYFIFNTKQGTYSSLFYWLNPVSVISSVSSPIHSLIHLNLSLLYYCAEMKLLIPSVTFLYTLLSYHFPFICLLPSTLISLCRKPNSDHTSFSLKRIYIILIFIITICFYLYNSITKSCIGDNKSIPYNQYDGCVNSVFSLLIHTTITKYANSSINYFYNIQFLTKWYLDAEIFHKYINYFNILYYFQPFIFTIPLSIRLQNHPNVIVS
jgi:hypothetical protein